MEWKLERTATRKVKTDEDVLWENIMKALGTDLGQIKKLSVCRFTKVNSKKRRVREWPGDSIHSILNGRGRESKGKVDMELRGGHTSELQNLEFQVTEIQTPDKTCYSQFKSCIVKKLAFRTPVASSPIATRWQEASMRNRPEQSFTECHPPELFTSDDGSDLTDSAEITTIPGSSKVLCKTTVSETIIDTTTTCLHKRSKTKKQIFITEENRDELSEKGSMRICEKHKCLWKGCMSGSKTECEALRISSHSKSFLLLEPEIRLHITGLRNDYYLNILDWSSGNLVAFALGSVVHIWNGETHQDVESIDLCSHSRYVSSVAWMQENGHLAFGTSDGDVQLWDIETQKRLRNLFGHMSVVGAMSCNGYILSSGSRLGYVYHHDVRSAQHHVGVARQSKQSVCSLQWSPDRRLLACGSSDGLLNIWPNDLGVTIQCRPFISIPHLSAVKAMMWCPWQSGVIAVGGGMKDKFLHTWNVNSAKHLQAADTKSQVCSVLWLPHNKELVTGQGYPGNKMNIWTYPLLSRSAELCGHQGRVLQMALSPEGNRIFSAAADDTAYVWKYRRIYE